MPRVLNLCDVGEVPGAVYIGRPSEFGNPYMIDYHGTREQVIEKFESYLRRNPKLMAKVKRELRGKDLLCWCSPKPCHADVLLKVANE